MECAGNISLVEFDHMSPNVTDPEFDAIKKLVYDQLGIYLSDQKKALVSNRLLKDIRTKNFGSFSQYIKYLKSDTTGKAVMELADSITTNHTHFFREKEHFDFMVARALPGIVTGLRESNDLDLRIWSAGCSSGEEPYTIAMVLKEYFGQTYVNWKAGVLASDISESILRAAKTAVYQPDQVAVHVPPQHRNKYFTKDGAGNYVVKPLLRKEVVYRKINLIYDEFQFKKPFHLIFCRNVMIYFDQPTRDELVRKFYDITAPGGYLFIGHSESIRSTDVPYRYIRPAVYKKD